MKARKWVLIGVAVLVIGGGGAFGAIAKARAAQTAAQAPQGQQVTVKSGTLQLSVTASGNLAAPDTANMTFGTGGTIASRPVDMGAPVKKGQVLAQLDTRDLKKALGDADSSVKSSEKAINDYNQSFDAASVAQAQAALASAQSQLSAAQKAYQDIQPPYNISPYDPSSVASAQAAVASAQAQVQAAQKAYQDIQPPYNISPYDPSSLASAQAAVATAQASLKNAENALVKASPATTSQDVAHLQAAVDDAQKVLDIAQQNLTSAKLSRDNSLANTQETLRQQQITYRGLIKMQLLDPTIYIDPAIILGTDTVPNAIETAYQALLKARSDAQLSQQNGDQSVATAQAEVDKDQDALKKAQQDLDTQLSDIPVNLSVQQYQVQQAKSTLAKAQADLQKAQAGPDPLDIANRKSALDNARANLVKAQADMQKAQAGPDPLDVANRKSALDTANANLVKAQEDLKKVQAGPDSFTVASLNAQSASAKTALAIAQDNLAKATIVAPFDGIAAAVTGNVGDTVGASTVVMQVVNPNKLRVEAMLDETSVTQVKLGQDAQVSLDALPNVTLTGKVTSIAPIATVQSGVVNYQVFITLDTQSATTRTPAGGNRTGQPSGQSRTGAPGAVGNGAAGNGQRGAPGSGPGQGASGTPRANGGQGQGAGALPTPAAAGNQVDAPQMKSGMTAVANVITTTYNNVLLIPRQAVSGIGQNRTVKVLVNGQVETRPVQLGANDDQNIMVVQGLSEGDVLLIPTPTTRTATPNIRPGVGGGFGGGGVIPGR